jgi:hypothetical protein
LISTLNAFFTKHKATILLACGLTFVAESCFVLVESLEPDPLSNDVEKLVEGGPPLLVVVHLLLRLLTSSAVHHSHLHTYVIRNSVQDPDSSINEQKKLRKTLISTVL